MSWLLDFLPWWTWYAVAGVALLLTIPWWWPLFNLVWAWLPSWAKSVIIGVGVALGAYLAGRNRGSSNERARQKARDANAIKTRLETNDAVARMDDATRKQRIDQWVRD